MKTIWKVFALVVVFCLSPLATVFASRTCDYGSAIDVRYAGEQSLVISKTEDDSGRIFESYEGAGCNSDWSITIEQEVLSYSFDLVDGQEMLSVAVQNMVGSRYANTVYSYRDGLPFNDSVIFTTEDKDDVIVYLKHLAPKLFLVGQSDESLRVWDPETGIQTVVNGVGEVVDVVFSNGYAFVLTDTMLYSVGPVDHYSWYELKDLISDDSSADSIDLAPNDGGLFVETDTAIYFLAVKDGYIQR